MKTPAPKRLPTVPCAGQGMALGLVLALSGFLLAGPAGATAADIVAPHRPAGNHEDHSLPAGAGILGSTNQPEWLLLNFHNAPIEQVLNWFSETAGFIVIAETPVTGTITLTGPAPLGLAEAVDQLTAELNRHNYTLIHAGRYLSIVAKSAAKTRDLPVKTGRDPELIPNNAEMATWIIPLRFVGAADLMKELSPFVAGTATVTVNEAANVLVVTDLQSNTRHLARIIQAVDNSAEAEREIRVFRLKYANPTEVASELNTVFGNDTTAANGATLPLNVPGGPGDFPGTPGETTARTSQPERTKTALQVNVVADARLSAVVVSAPPELQRQIARVMDSLDRPSARDQKVFVYHLDHGDPNQVLTELQGLFAGNSDSQTTANSAQTSALQQRATKNGSATTSSSSTGNSANAGSGTAGGGGGGP